MHRAILSLILISMSFFINAQDLKFSAFGTVGVTISSSEQYGYRTDIGQDKGVFSGDIDVLSASLLGGQLEANVSQSIDFVGQLVLRDLTEPSTLDYVSMAFFRYSPSAAWTFRVGRLSPDLFMITEYRDVNVAYTWANVPNEVYGMIPFKAFDGGDVTYSQRLREATVSAKLFGGVGESVISANGPINETIKLDSMIGIALTFDQNDWNLQGRYTTAKLGNESISAQYLKTGISQVPDFLWPNKPSIYQKLALKGHSLHYLSFSGQKFVDDWLFNFEFAQINSGSKLIPKLLSGYASAAYQINDHTFYSVLAKTKSDLYHFNEPVQAAYFPELVGQIEQAMNFYTSNQSTVSLGWRWDVTTTVTSKLQLNLTNIDENGATLWINKGHTSPSERVTSMMYTLSFAL